MNQQQQQQHPHHNNKTNGPVHHHPLSNVVAGQAVGPPPPPIGPPPFTSGPYPVPMLLPPQPFPRGTTRMAGGRGRGRGRGSNRGSILYPSNHHYTNHHHHHNNNNNMLLPPPPPMMMMMGPPPPPMMMMIPPQQQQPPPPIALPPPPTMIRPQQQHHYHHHPRQYQHPPIHHQQQQQQQHQPFATLPAPPFGLSPQPTPAPTASTPVSRQQVVGEWIIHTPHMGQTYYYNTITQQSQYDVPASMTASTLNTTATATTTQPSAGGGNQTSTPWIEYKDSVTGKSYYSNGIDTTWERPTELDQPTTTIAQSQQQPEEEQQQQHDASSSDPPPKKKSKSEEPPLLPTYATKEDATRAFMQLLKHRDIAPNIKYNDVQKQLQNDTIWLAVESQLTNGNRKQLLAEYQTKKSNELKLSARQEKLQAKQNLLQLLQERHVGIVHRKDFPDPSTTTPPSWETLERELQDDPRLVAVEPAERPIIYQEYIQDVKNRLERYKRNQYRQAHDAYWKFLQSIVHHISSDTLFEELSQLPPPAHLPQQQQEEEEDDNVAAVAVVDWSSILTEPERRSIFADFIQDLKHLESTQLSRKIHNHYPQQQHWETRRNGQSDHHHHHHNNHYYHPNNNHKRQSMILLDCLHDLAKSERIVPATPWEVVKPLLPPELLIQPSLLLFNSNGEDEPQQDSWSKHIYQDFATQWSDVYRKDRQILMRLVPRDHPLNDITFDEFVQILQHESTVLYSKEPELQKALSLILSQSDSARLYFRELTGRLNHYVMAPPPSTKHTTGNHNNKQQNVKNRIESSEDEGQVAEDDEEEDDDDG